MAAPVNSLEQEIDHEIDLSLILRYGERLLKQ